MSTSLMLVGLTDFEGWWRMEQNYGTIKVHLAELIAQVGISKNKLSQRAEMQRTQVNSYCNGTITRLDIAVLARLCTVLECDISDLLEYIPPEIGEEGNE